MFLIKKTFSNILSGQNTLYFFRNMSKTPLRSPLRLKIWGRDHPIPRIDAPAIERGTFRPTTSLILCLCPSLSLSVCFCLSLCLFHYYCIVHIYIYIYLYSASLA